MSRTGKAGKQAWKEQEGAFGKDLADRISAQSAEQMRAWEQAGRIPLRVRIVARLRGQHLKLPGDTRR
jgi:hypothetical protein